MAIISCLVRSATNPSITQLSDWHIQQIRKLVPEWQHFHAFLANFDELLDLSSEETDRLFDAIYPESYLDFQDDYDPFYNAGSPKETCWNGYDDDGEFFWKDMAELQRMPHMQEMVAPSSYRPSY